MSVYSEKLLKAVMEASFDKSSWKNAVSEWSITDVEEDEMLESSCVCSKENLRFLFEITNQITSNVLFPIGSSCIKKFGRNELYQEASVAESMFKLLHAIEDRKFIVLSSEFFSRNLLQNLYENSVIEENEYEFLLKMFNKKDKSSITTRQQSWINRLIAYSILPWLKKQYADKIRKKGGGA